MNGLMAVRSISASISARADWIAPLISSRVTASRLGMALMSVQRNNQVAVAIDLAALPGKDKRRRVELIDDRRSAQAMAGEQGFAPIHGHVTMPRPIEAHAAMLIRSGRRAGRAYDLRQRDL